MSEEMKMDAERAAFEAAFEGEFFSSCFEREDDGSYAGRGLQGAWLGWRKARGSLPVVVPDGFRADAERCSFVLRYIASMESDEIDGDNIDVRFEDLNGFDTGCDISIVDYAEKAANVIDAMLAAAPSAPAGEAVPACDPWTPSMSDYDRSIHANPDAKAWADLFVSTFPGLADKHDLMIGWFANAMMAMHDYLKSREAVPAAGAAYGISLPSVAEFGEWVGPEDNGLDSATRGMLLALFKWTLDRVCALNANRAALSAQQSAQLVGGDSVSVPVELVEKAMLACFEAGHGFTHDALRALLSRNGNGGEV